MSKRWLVRVILALAAGTYGVSFLLPVGTFACCGGEAPVPGFAVFLAIPAAILHLLGGPQQGRFDFLAVAGMSAAWAANPLYWGGLVSLARRRWLWAAGLSLTAVLLGLAGLAPVYGLRWGYYVWLASLALPCAGGLCLFFYPEDFKFSAGRLSGVSAESWKSSAACLPVLPSAGAPSTDVKPAGPSGYSAGRM
jgi:hypothetical protein